MMRTRTRQLKCVPRRDVVGVQQDFCENRPRVSESCDQPLSLRHLCCTHDDSLHLSTTINVMLPHGDPLAQLTVYHFTLRPCYHAYTPTKEHAHLASTVAFSCLPVQLQILSILIADAFTTPLLRLTNGKPGLSTTLRKLLVPHIRLPSEHHKNRPILPFAICQTKLPRSTKMYHRPCTHDPPAAVMNPPKVDAILSETDELCKNARSALFSRSMPGVQSLFSPPRLGSDPRSWSRLANGTGQLLIASAWEESGEISERYLFSRTACLSNPALDTGRVSPSVMPRSHTRRFASVIVMAGQ